MSPITRSVTLNPEEVKVVGVTWTPALSGQQCVQVKLHDQGGIYDLQESRRNLEVIKDRICGEKSFSFTLRNPTPEIIFTFLGTRALNLPSGWEYALHPPGPFELDPFESIAVTLTVSIPCPAGRALQPQTGGTPTIDVESIYNGLLIGGVEVQFPRFALIPLYLPAIRR
jgi:hypothetical protein